MFIFTLYLSLSQLKNTIFKLCSFFCVIIGGVSLQLGIAGITGPGLYAMRVIENICIMTVITTFSYHSFDCWKCADKTQRQAWSHVNDDGNQRIFSWIICGWIAIIVHVSEMLLILYFKTISCNAIDYIVY